MTAAPGDAVGWFPGDEPRSDDEARFLARLRQAAATWQVPGLTPDQSWCLARMVPLFVQIEHPSLANTGGLTSLQVGYWPSSSGIRLEAQWGDDYLLDNGGDDSNLRLRDALGEPEVIADVAAAWIDAQLHRPVERLEWLSRKRVAATRIRLADSGQTLIRRGSWLRARGAPDRTTRLN